MKKSKPFKVAYFPRSYLVVVSLLKGHYVIFSPDLCHLIIFKVTKVSSILWLQSFDIFLKPLLFEESFVSYQRVHLVTSHCQLLDAAHGWCIVESGLVVLGSSPGAHSPCTRLDVTEPLGPERKTIHETADLAFPGEWVRVSDGDGWGVPYCRYS